MTLDVQPVEVELEELRDALTRTRRDLEDVKGQLQQQGIIGASSASLSVGSVGFGDRNMRLDKNGIQLVPGSVEAPVGIRILPAVIEKPADGTFGYSMLGFMASATSMGVVDGVSTTLDNLSTATDVVKIAKNIGSSSSEMILTVKDDTDTALVGLLASTSLNVRRFYLTDTGLTLAQVANDAAIGTVNDGTVWYDTTTDKFRGVVSGANLNFLMEGEGGMSLIVKAADETVNNSTTLQDDDHLLFAVAANEKWQFEGVLMFEGPTTADMKFAFSGPAASVGAWAGLQLEGTAQTDIGAELGTAQVLAFANSARQHVRFWGSIANGANAGNLKLEWAQDTATVADTTMHAGSYIKYQQQ